MSLLPDALARILESVVGPITGVTRIGGGCIANASRLETPVGPFFLKWSEREGNDVFDMEATGLKTLHGAARTIKVPDVVSHGHTPDAEIGYLLLEYVTEGTATTESARRLGSGLAELHRHEGPFFGYEIDNVIGRLPQNNTPAEEWPEFFRTCRLLPQVDMARERGGWKDSWEGPCMRLLNRLDDLLPAAPAKSVLHGDLWSGNYLVGSSGEPVLIDPAVYYGDRETDLAMMTLFGGFDSVVFDSYLAEWPLEAGWRERRDIYQLYHLINHLNHFGASYAAGVETILRRY